VKEGHKDIKDILKEVGDEEGFSEKEMMDLWEHQKRYINKLQDTEDVYAIFLPYLGTLSLNTKQYKRDIKVKNRSFYKDFGDKVKKLMKHKDFTLCQNAHKKTTSVHRLTKYLLRYYDTGLEVKETLKKHNRCWEVIAKYSNNVFKKS
jgi:hypothetical protein